MNKAVIHIPSIQWTKDIKQFLINTFGGYTIIKGNSVYMSKTKKVIRRPVCIITICTDHPHSYTLTMRIVNGLLDNGEESVLITFNDETRFVTKKEI